MIVPAKSFGRAKLRLSPVLTADERAMLARAMLTDVVGAALSVSDPDNIAVVTGPDDVAREAARLGVRVIDDDGATEINPAIVAGLAAVRRSGGRRVLILPGDVPAVTGETISTLLEIAARGRVAIVPATHDGGTNALALDSPDRLEACFGLRSLARHIVAAHRAGVKPVIVPNARLGLDIDRPDDLVRFLDLRTSTATDHYLRSLGIARRNVARFAAMEIPVAGAVLRGHGAAHLELGP
ncbi:MAG: 2-phospho-L-lactate guanylyltransferase [Xanthobacteraceae bacterium]|nr:2-phospho-L-lactate guanylyltransferase [Xanthobacteraceae bacterium]